MDSSATRLSFPVQIRMLCILAVACFVLSKQMPTPDVHMALERINQSRAMQLVSEEVEPRFVQGAVSRGVSFERLAQADVSGRQHASPQTIPYCAWAAPLCALVPLLSRPSGVRAGQHIQPLPSWRGLIFFALPPPSRRA